jgi:3-deoxy-D-manno-octulosonate 8-phosphate phosphatase (KDO 8-P phosphatase)
MTAAPLSPAPAASGRPADAAALLDRARAVRLAIFDVDGVLTDGHLYYGPQGELLKAFNTLDGHGIKMLAGAGVASAIITGRQSEIVASRCRELGIVHLYQGVHDKTAAFAQLLAATGLEANACAYMGDDWPDLAVMLRVGLAAAPVNAHPEVSARAHWVSTARGGEGAVRELCDTVLRAQQHYEALLASACGG